MFDTKSSCKIPHVRLFVSSIMVAHCIKNRKKALHSFPEIWMEMETWMSFSQSLPFVFGFDAVMIGKKSNEESDFCLLISIPWEKLNTGIIAFSYRNKIGYHQRKVLMPFSRLFLNICWQFCEWDVFRKHLFADFPAKLVCHSLSRIRQR
jgi:hypothetical protein